MTHGFSFVKNPVLFVKASRESKQFGGEIASERPVKPSVLTGDEAKNFYEDLVNSPAPKRARQEENGSKRSFPRKRSKLKADVKPSKAELKRTTYAKQSREFSPTVTDLFKAAEKGSLQEVKKIVESRVVDIDATDHFSWTALMMAAHQGHEDIVKFLLLQGADWENKVDASGYDAFDLACLGGYDGIAHLLRHRKSIIRTEGARIALSQARKSVKREKLWCEICETHYDADPGGGESLHHHSVSHQFCSLTKKGDKLQSSFYLNASNKGYNMLKSHGWDGSSGLGPSSSGRKYPVKTVLKRDRTGFGCETEPARVTHFASLDTKAVKQAEKVKLKTLHKKKDERLKDLEIDFRRSFY